MDKLYKKNLKLKVKSININKSQIIGINIGLNLQ